MKSASAFHIILVTVGSKQNGREIAEVLVSRKLAACVNQVPGIESTYFWKEKVCHDTEQLLIIKARASALAEIEKVLSELHSYEVPEMITFPLSQSTKAYLAWLEEVTEKGDTER